MQPHLKLMTDLGRGYHIRCRYKNREAAIKSTSFATSKDDVDGEHQENNEQGEEEQQQQQQQRPQAYTSDEKKTDRRDHGRALMHGYAIINVHG